jgi:hypothetical protein
VTYTRSSLHPKETKEVGYLQLRKERAREVRVWRMSRMRVRMC